MKLTLNYPGRIHMNLVTGCKAVSKMMDCDKCYLIRTLLEADFLETDTVAVLGGPVCPVPK